MTFTEWLGYGFPVMVLLVPSMIFSLWVILRPDFSVEFNPSLEKVSFNRKNIITFTDLYRYGDYAAFQLSSKSMD